MQLAWKGQLETIRYINQEKATLEDADESTGVLLMQCKFRLFICVVNALADMKIDNRKGIF
jgi:hypothetical protein